LFGFGPSQFCTLFYALFELRPSQFRYNNPIEGRVFWVLCTVSLLIIHPQSEKMVSVGAVMVLDKIIPDRGGFLLGSMHCFSINYVFSQVGGKVWVGTKIDFCAYKNMFTCLAAVRFLRVLKHVCMPFFCRCKVSVPAKTCFYAFVVM